MNLKTAFFKAGFIVIAAIVGFVISSVTAPKNYIPQASAQACATPGQVPGVVVDFPSCVGSQCSFIQAKCSWGSVSGATKYQVTVTEVETGTVAVNEQVEASVTSKIFSVNQNKTYKCDVSAINSCGAVGPAGTHSLLCEVDALVATPTTAPPGSTSSVPTTAPAQSSCGYPCGTTANCKSGYTCAIGSNGQGYCAVPAYVSSCQSSPSISVCCTAPTSAPAPTIPPPGSLVSTIAIALGSTVVILLGISFFIL